ncbi:MAG TPA: hypothetical protein VF039_13725 [Longimicrobiales bacterium]
MLSFVDRAHAWQKAALDRLKRRSWKAWLAVVVVGYAILEVVRAWVSDAGTLLLVWAFRGADWIVRQPMGVGGLALLGFVAVLIGVSWRETRPAPKTPAAVPPKPSESERRLIQDIRTIWNRHGTLATGQLRYILGNAIYNLEGRVFWAELLTPIIANLDDRVQKTNTSLNESSPVGIAEVRQRFNAMYAAYVRAMKWVALLQSEGLLVVGPGETERLEVWRQNHRDMVDRLRDLNEDPEHRGTLKTYLNWVDNPAISAFFREAEMSQAWLDLMRKRREGDASGETPKLDG